MTDEHESKVLEKRIILRDINTEEIQMVAQHSVAICFSRQESCARKDILQRIMSEQEIAWLMRVVQANNQNEDSIARVLEVDGKTAGSVIVERETDEGRKHSANFELYLVGEARSEGFEKAIFLMIAKKIRQKWNGEVAILNSICLSKDSVIYEKCGFRNRGAKIMSVLSPDGLYSDETFLQRQLY